MDMGYLSFEVKSRAGENVVVCIYLHMHACMYFWCIFVCREVMNGMMAKLMITMMMMMVIRLTLLMIGDCGGDGGK